MDGPKERVRRIGELMQKELHFAGDQRVKRKTRFIQGLRNL